MDLSPFQFVENPRSIKSACVRAGELEGAAARLEWDQMPGLFRQPAGTGP